MSTPASLQSERRGNLVVVSLSGELDVFNATEIMASIESSVPSEAHAAVIDLTGVGFVDSTAIRRLFALVARFTERRQRVRVVSPRGSGVLRTLDLVEFSHAAAIHHTLDEAISRLDAAGAE